jgi:3-oxoacyl-[acyl-carrier protein] reductase
MLTGKIAVVTGASKGIGRAAAVTLGKNGASVAVHYNSSKEDAEIVKTEIEEGGGKAFIFQADVRESSQVKSLFDATEDHFKDKIDIVVVSAGVITTKPIGTFTDEDFDWIFQTNVYGAFYTLREAATRVRTGVGGRIIALSSTTTTKMLPGYSVYAASKAPIEQFCQHLAKELGPNQITINAISPGPTDTELFRKGKTEEFIKQLSSMTSLGRIGEPQEIADVILFLASDASRWITGQNIRVNGGF